METFDRTSEATSSKMTRYASYVSGVAGFLLLALAAPVILAEGLVDEPDGYRLENYDDVVPDTLKGAKVVEAEQVRDLRDDRGAVIIDVIPAQRRPDFLPENQVWIPVPHKGVPGSLWLPDIGYGVLSDVTLAYFFDNLETATDKDKSHPVVFYCRDNCWMSWNAAKRALEHGYTDVYWFAEGTEGWFESGFEFADLTPAEGERQ